MADVFFALVSGALATLIVNGIFGDDDDGGG